MLRKLASLAIFLSFLISLLMLVASLVLQYGLGLQPCLLCLLDRMIIFVLVITSGLVLLFSQPKIRIGFILFTVLFCVFGIISSGRHLWILSLPAAKIPTCSPGLDYLLKTVPLPEILGILFQGGGECTKDVAKLFGIALPIWSFVGFLCLLIINVLAICNKKGRHAPS